MRSHNPVPQAGRFGLFRFRSPLLTESQLLSFPSGTEMFHFPEYRPRALCIQTLVIPYGRIGFPHSDIPGSKRVCRSPRLIAAYHVLHRLLVPRHSSYALHNLATKITPPFTPSIRTEQTMRSPLSAPLCCRKHDNTTAMKLPALLSHVVVKEHSTHSGHANQPRAARMSALPAHRSGRAWN